MLLKKYKSVNELKNLLKNLKNDEINHKIEALSEIKNFNILIKLWEKLCKLDLNLQFLFLIKFNVKNYTII